MTKRMYLVDNYVRKFKSTVIKTTSEGLVLKETYFYPEGGGQPGDRGTLIINNQPLKVKNTRIRQNMVIHETCPQNFPVGIEMEGKIDWEYRYELMRSHSAQHVISRYFQINYQADTVSTQLKQSKSRLDFHPLRKIPLEELEAITKEINVILTKNLPISIETLPREEAFNYLQEKKYQTKYLEMVPKSVKSIRVISIGDYDFAACAGTHVKNTSEIGKISLIGTKNKGKLRERIFYSVD